MNVYLIYGFAGLAEIAGCFAFWAWLKLDKSAMWLVPGMLSLAAFAWALRLFLQIKLAGHMRPTVAFILSLR